MPEGLPRVTGGGPGRAVRAGADEHAPATIRIDGYTCSAVYPLSDSELRDIVRTLDAPARPAALPGTRGPLAGRAAVWRHDVASIGPVVIKEYRRGGVLRVVRRRQFLRVGPTRPEREMRNLRVARAAGLRVPDPVAWFSRGRLFYTGWLATRYIDGRSLAQLVSSGFTATPDLIADIVRQVDILIRNRVAHVDLHPGNVLVDARGLPHLLDFDRAVAFTDPLEDLRRNYEVRWTRAIEKHGFPRALAEWYREGLRELARHHR